MTPRCTCLMAEKLIFSLPPVRVDQPMYLALTQFAAAPGVDRSVGYVVREAVREYLAAHGVIVPEHEPTAKQCPVSQCDARKAGE